MVIKKTQAKLRDCNKKLVKRSKITDPKFA